MMLQKVLQARLKSGLTRKEAADKLGIPEKLMLALELGADHVIYPGKSISDEQAIKILENKL